MEARKPLIRDALTELVHPSSLLWDNNLPSRVLEGLPTENQTEGSVPEELEVPENGCVYLVPAPAPTYSTASATWAASASPRPAPARNR